MKIDKFNEFFNDNVIIKMLEKVESTPLPNLVEISQKNNYKEIISMGDKVIPILIKRIEKSGPFWNIALESLTGVESPKQVDGDIITYDVDEIKHFWNSWYEKKQ